VTALLALLLFPLEQSQEELRAGGAAGAWGGMQPCSGTPSCCASRNRELLTAL